MTYHFMVLFYHRYERISKHERRTLLYCRSSLPKRKVVRGIENLHETNTSIVHAIGKVYW
jgi:hypothetical protein